MYVNKQMTKYIHLSKYSKWVEELGRREPTWQVTTQRLSDFWFTEHPDLSEEEKKCLSDTFLAVSDQSVMPSMRSLMTAGKALRRDHAAGFNCAAIAVNHQRVFDEIFYLLMCGSGVGFSVERQYTDKLPVIAEEFFDTDTTIDVGDSKIGWAKALKELIALLYNGDIPLWDLCNIRPAGARLKTFGGRASGPKPLDLLFRYVVRVFSRAAGRKLNSLECHDLVCKIADTVIVGSVRRSACISLSNLSDPRMAGAKRGAWYESDPQRALANNSVAYTEKPDLNAYLKEMRNLLESKAGERGIVNKVALRKKAESCGREYKGDYLLNPCGEAILRDSGGLCNLTEVVVREFDVLADLKEKVKYATILGTLQSTLTDFRYLRKVWKDNQEEERLLGVSLTGIMDHPVLSGQFSLWADGGCPELEGWLKEMKDVAKRTNEEWAGILGIPTSGQLTLVKPSGTVSQLVGSASGIHPRYAPFYLRRVTQDSKDPLTDLMKHEGVPFTVRGEKTIFSFPIKSPRGSVCARDMGAMEQLELWKVYREYWCDGNPSQTIYYTDNDFLKVQSWVYDNWDIIGGLSFFPLDDFIYDRDTQPYLEINEEQYAEALGEFPEDIDWESLPDFEEEDCTSGEQEFACAGGSCDL